MGTEEYKIITISKIRKGCMEEYLRWTLKDVKLSSKFITGSIAVKKPRARTMVLEGNFGWLHC